MKRFSQILLALVSVSSLSAPALAELRPDKVHVADAKKNLSYIRDGLFVGGDKAIDDVVVKDIRRAANPGGFERVVIDLQGTKNGEPAAIPRPPYYQVAVTPDEKRIVFTIWGKPKLGFDSRESFLQPHKAVGVGLFLRARVGVIGHANRKRRHGGTPEFGWIIGDRRRPG